MASISQQIRQLKKLIVVPYQVKFVSEYVKKEDFEDKTIYIHIWI